MIQDQLSQTAEGNELTACGIFGMQTFSPYSHGCIPAADWVACQRATTIMESSNTKVLTGGLVVMVPERSSEWPSARNRKAAVQMLNPKGDSPEHRSSILWRFSKLWEGLERCLSQQRDYLSSMKT